eukprot:3674137-Amphidinium_carterae.1
MKSGEEALAFQAFGVYCVFASDFVLLIEFWNKEQFTVGEVTWADLASKCPMLCGGLKPSHHTAIYETSAAPPMCLVLKKICGTVSLSHLSEL